MSDGVPEIFLPPFLPPSPESSYTSGVEFLTLAAAALEKEDDTRSSIPKRVVFRDRERAHTELYDQYFSDVPVYDDDYFRLRYRMSRSLFLEIVEDITVEFEWFRVGYDARKKSFTPLQKCTCALRQLAYGNVPDNYDESLAMSARTARECLEFFCNTMIKLYRKDFLSTPTSHDIARLYEHHGNKHHFPDMIGSIDCTHWVWWMCPRALRGQYHRGDHQHPTIILEAVAPQDLWFWHSYLGVAGSNSDINVIMQSPLFTPYMHGVAPECSFNVNGRHYKRGYYLTDGIYPARSTFVKSYAYPTNGKEKVLKKLQEAARKDVERAFCVLKLKFSNLARPTCMKKKQKMINTMYACIILHNMIIKDDGKTISSVYIPDPPMDVVPNANFEHELHNEETHYTLRCDLADHIDSLNLDVNVDED